MISSLELLQVLHNCYIYYQPNGINKGTGLGSDPTELVRHVQDAHQLMHFYTEANLAKMLVACVLHYMIDVKSLATELLSQFRPKFSLVTSLFK